MSGGSDQPWGGGAGDMFSYNKALEWQLFSLAQENNSKIGANQNRNGKTDESMAKDWSKQFSIATYTNKTVVH